MCIITVFTIVMVWKQFEIPSKDEWIKKIWTSQMALVVKNLPASAGEARNLGFIPGFRRSSGRGQGDSLQYSCLENLMDRGAWWTRAHCDFKYYKKMKVNTR